jgi:hypothetical protein
MSNRAQEIEALKAKIAEYKADHKGTALLTARLFSLRARQLNEEIKMDKYQEARDANAAHEIALSCSVVLRHASFIGVEAEKMVRLRYPALCMDELNEAAGVLQRALNRVELAKEILLSKVSAEAAE